MLPTGIRRSFNPIASACEQAVELRLQWRQITGVSIVYSTVCSGADQRKHQSSASLAFVRGIHRRPVNSSHKGPVTRKMFPFDDVIMTRNCRSWSTNVRIPLARPQKFEWPVWHCLLIYWPGNGCPPISGQTILLNDRSDRSKPLWSIIDQKANLRSIICRFFIIVKWIGLLLWKQYIIITVRLRIWDNSFIIVRMIYQDYS